MQLQQLNLTSFKNHALKTFEFKGEIVVLCGENGTGKTNVLDAIYLLCMCKSYFQASEINNIRHQDPFYSVFGKCGDNEIACMVRRGQGKIFRFNGKEYDKLSEHIGKMPVVMIAPSDIELIYGGSEQRRRFMDTLLSQTDREYLSSLQLYLRGLEQRNRLLKQGSEKGYTDNMVLEAVTRQLIAPAELIFKKRRQFIKDFLPHFYRYHKLLTEGKEDPELVYESLLLEKDPESWFRSNLSRDMELGRTEKGIHRDDLELLLNTYPVKKFGSQGQVKSYLIALRLAQSDFLKEKTGTKPFLLLDDIFEKLDQPRTRKLMQLVAQSYFGQIFITDTHRERIETIFAGTGAFPQIIHL
jgi:DNA replication and repair protein RecF